MKNVVLAGNPNVGKSTVFNALTGLKQHTGNWTGKTVQAASGRLRGSDITLTDLPGCYSLAYCSPEEAAACRALLSGADAAVVVCDATCPERGIALLLEIAPAGLPLMLCVNLMDEAARKGVTVDTALLEQRLGVPVVPCAARKKRGLDELVRRLDQAAVISPALLDGIMHGDANYADDPENPAKTADDPENPSKTADDPENPSKAAGIYAKNRDENGINPPQYPDGTLDIPERRVAAARRLCRGAVTAQGDIRRADNRIDRVITGRVLAFPLMLVCLAAVFYLTMVAANYPSQWLADGFAALEGLLRRALAAVNCHPLAASALMDGVYRVLAWVVAVMLPPMAIFFPLFSLLEDAGFLPRIAFNLDGALSRCGACGKQSLTMCMGLGCNAVGVTGARIIDSPRERLAAVLTNSFIPCNGRLPLLLTLITCFFARGVLAAVGLAGAVVLAGGLSLLCTLLLNKTLLKGKPSFFTLELPPYRPPQIGRVLVRSLLDRTLKVLGRAVAIAAPAGLLLWLLANISAGEGTPLAGLCGALQPVGEFFGMDGVILAAFILGLPANEIVLPIMLMCYTGAGTISACDADAAQQILLSGGWTAVTALCTTVFALLHWPCATTIATIKKETGSARLTAVAILLPTACGMTLCALINALARLF